ncbi:heavy-metal-associated domain-containing protein [Halothiobacillus sp. DCM-1]|uniref:CopZ family metallochaperone n=1 Tax=Halothiobacillus sp. DCM-1 TaxID=3112558 RepID=UPI003245819E
MTPITLNIEGMRCNHCVQAARSALSAVPGVSGVQVTLEPAQAIVSGTAPVEALIAALADEGYTARVDELA